MKKILFIFALGLSSFAHAALPPLYQTSNEIKAVLANPEFGQKLHSGEVIESIQKNEKGYLITTNYNTLQVNIQYKHNGKIGPAEFSLQFEDPKEIVKDLKR